MTYPNEKAPEGSNVAVQQIEVTPEMIETGVKAYLSWDHLEDDPAEIVREIFCEMRRAYLQALSQAQKL